MWPFKNKKASLHFELDQLDSLILAIEGLDGAQKVGEEMNIVGSLDMATFEYKVGSSLVVFSVENYSGIDLEGDTDIVDQIASKMKKQNK